VVLLTKGVAKCTSGLFSTIDCLNLGLGNFGGFGIWSHRNGFVVEVQSRTLVPAIGVVKICGNELVLGIDFPHPNKGFFCISHQGAIWIKDQKVFVVINGLKGGSLIISWAFHQRGVDVSQLQMSLGRQKALGMVVDQKIQGINGRIIVLLLLGNFG